MRGFQVYGRYKNFFIDADPKIFERWIAPFIRDRVLPDKGSIKDKQEWQSIVATANRIGLSVIVDHLTPKKGSEDLLNELPVLDVDPDIFKRWIAPYLRFNILPDKKLIKDG